MSKAQKRRSDLELCKTESDKSVFQNYIDSFPKPRFTQKMGNAGFTPEFRQTVIEFYRLKGSEWSKSRIGDAVGISKRSLGNLLKNIDLGYETSTENEQISPQSANANSSAEPHMSIDGEHQTHIAAPFGFNSPELNTRQIHRSTDNDKATFQLYLEQSPERRFDHVKIGRRYTEGFKQAALGFLYLKTPKWSKSRIARAMNVKGYNLAAWIWQVAPRPAADIAEFQAYIQSHPRAMCANHGILNKNTSEFKDAVLEFHRLKALTWDKSRIAKAIGIPKQTFYHWVAHITTESTALAMEQELQDGQYWGLHTEGHGLSNSGTCSALAQGMGSRDYPYDGNIRAKYERGRGLGETYTALDAFQNDIGDEYVVSDEDCQPVVGERYTYGPNTLQETCSDVDEDAASDWGYSMEGAEFNNNTLLTIGDMFTLLPGSVDVSQDCQLRICIEGRHQGEDYPMPDHRREEEQNGANGHMNHHMENGKVEEDPGETDQGRNTVIENDQRKEEVDEMPQDKQTPYQEDHDEGEHDNLHDTENQAAPASGMSRAFYQYALQDQRVYDHSFCLKPTHDEQDYTFFSPLQSPPISAPLQPRSHSPIPGEINSPIWNKILKKHSDGFIWKSY